MGIHCKQSVQIMGVVSFTVMARFGRAGILMFENSDVKTAMKP